MVVCLSVSYLTRSFLHENSQIYCWWFDVEVMSIAIVLTIHTTEVDPHPNPHTISIGRDFISLVWVYTDRRSPYYFSLQIPLIIVHILVLHTIVLIGVVVSKYTSP